MRDRVWRRAILLGFLPVVSLSFSETCKAQVTVSANQLDFGSVYLGHSAKQSITVTNTGTIPLIMFQPSLTGDFSYQSNCPFLTPVTLDMFAVDAVCSIDVQFSPSQAGVESQTLSFPVYSQWPDATTPPLQTVTISLTGTGLIPVTLSPSVLDFGYVLEGGYSSPSMPVTLSNVGNVGVHLIFNSYSGVSVQNQTCEQQYGFYIPAGQSCTVAVAVGTNVTGSQTLTYGMDVYNEAIHLLGQVTGTVKFIGHPLSLGYPSNFGIVLIGTSANATARLANFGSKPVNVYSVTVSGAPFSLAGSCIGSLAPGASCPVMVTYTPTQAVTVTGTLTVKSDDPSSPQSIALTGTGTAAKFTLQGPASVFNRFYFQHENLDIPSSPSQLILTNTGPVDLALKGIKLSGDDYREKNKCKSSLAPGASCTVDITFDPAADGLSQGKLTVAVEDPASPKSFDLSGYGVGIGHQTVYIHYDYMVAPDHTDDPEVVAPGAMKRIVKAFEGHGIDLVIDPHHTAIPAVPVVDYFSGCRQYPEFSNLVAKYFIPKFPDQHYVVFVDTYTYSDIGCQPRSGGFSELPGQHFLVALYPRVEEHFTPELLSLFCTGLFMHELGHNFGLHHGGGYGRDGDDLNYEPNYISVMNYRFNLSGIPEADAVGSNNLRTCSSDPDCPKGGSCIHYSSTGAACYRVDYSNQLLPTGGNTPGALDENNLNEPAGLGSGGTDITFFTPGCGLAADIAASEGPIDWNGNGDPTETSIVDDIHYNAEYEPYCFTTVLAGWNDWASLLGTKDNDSVEQYATQSSGATSATSAAGDPTNHPFIPELDLDTAKRMHVLLPLRPAPVVIEPSCRAPGKPVLPYRAGIVTVALLATGDFDVHQVDLSSLNFHHAKPAKTWFEDVDGDGNPDLVMQFRGSEVRLSKQATKAHLTGWLASSQAFVGEREVTVSANSTQIAPACR